MGIRFDLATVPTKDEAVYDMLCKGDSVGVFQVESRVQMNMLPRLRPRKFYDLVIEVAIVRPGPIQGDMVHPYLRRRNNEEPVEFPSPGPGHDPDELRKILERTLGVPIFQEQAMKIAIDAARFSPSEANELRKAMATFRSCGTIGELQDKMVNRMICRARVMLGLSDQTVVLLVHFPFSALDNYDASALNLRRTSPMNSPSNSPLGSRADGRADLLTPMPSARYAGRDRGEWVEIAGGRQERNKGEFGAGPSASR